MLSRKEVNGITGKVTEYLQVVYVHSESGKFLLVDEGTQAPDGYVLSSEEARLAGQVTVPTQADYDNALMQIYQDTAVSMNYQSWQTCALRAYKPGPFEIECTAFYDWMESCNTLGYKILADVMEGRRIQPTIQEFLSELPVFKRPANAQ